MDYELNENKELTTHLWDMLDCVDMWLSIDDNEIFEEWKSSVEKISKILEVK